MPAMLCGSCQKRLAGGRNLPDLVIDKSALLVRYKGKLVELGNQPYLLLEALADARGGVVSLVRLIEACGCANESALRTIACRLRKKVGSSAIESVAKMGYQMNCEYAFGLLR